MSRSLFVECISHTMTVYQTGVSQSVCGACKPHNDRTSKGVSQSVCGVYKPHNDRTSNGCLCPFCPVEIFQAFPKRQILDPSKLKVFADDNFKLHENGRKFSNGVENTVGKGEIARDEQFLLFPQCFQKNYTADT